MTDTISKEDWDFAQKALGAQAGKQETPKTEPIFVQDTETENEAS